MVIALFFYLLALVVWLGGMVFFTAIAAPVVFKLLPQVEAGRFVAGIFPRYYIMGYVAGAISLVLALYFTVRGQPRLLWSLASLALAARIKRAYPHLTVAFGGANWEDVCATYQFR